MLASEKKISIRQLEETLGFGNGVINRWRHNTPGVDKVELVANYFHVSVDYLLGRTDNPNSEPADQSIKSSARQIMMRMNTEGLSEEDFDEVEKEMERFLKWRIEEIKREKDGEVR